MLDIPKSTVALRLRYANVEPVTRDGERDLYNAAHVIPILLKPGSSR